MCCVVVNPTTSLHTFPQERLYYSNTIKQVNLPVELDCSRVGRIVTHCRRKLLQAARCDGRQVYPGYTLSPFSCCSRLSHTAEPKLIDDKRV